VAVQLYMDVHVPQAITDQLRRRGIDVLTAIEDDSGELLDDELLERVRSLERVLFMREPFSELIFWHHYKLHCAQIMTCYPALFG
jgi:Domain of unknown function (DUF5615)